MCISVHIVHFIVPIQDETNRQEEILLWDCSYIVPVADSES